MAADLHVREEARRPAVGELAVRQVLVMREPEAPRPLTLALLHGRADLARRAFEGIGVHAGVGHHEAQPRIHRLLVGDTVRLPAQRHDHAAEAVRVQIVLAEVLHHRLGLRMDVRQVIGLVEGVDADLPVRVPHRAHMTDGVHLIDAIVLEVALRQADPVREGRGLAIEVDEHETGVDPATHLCEARAMRDQRRIEGLLVRDRFEITVAVELPAVERAGEVIDAAVGVERHAVRAMRADVVEGLDAAVVLAGEEDRLRADVEGEVIARFRDVAGDAGEQPHPRPHALPFELHELRAEIARRIGDLRAVVDGGLLALEGVGRGVGIDLVVEAHGAPG